MFNRFFDIPTAHVRHLLPQGFLHSIICLALAALGLQSYAQGTRDTVAIGDVEVSARRTEHLRHSIAPLQTLNAISLERLGAAQLGDAVKQLAGVQVKDYGGIGGLKTVSVRSLGARHTAVTYDGVPLADEQSGQADIGRLSLLNVQEVSLSSGQSSDIFMPARAFAAGATLAITTALPTPLDSAKRSIHAALRAGSFGVVSPSASYTQTVGKRFAFALSGEYLRAAGDYPFTLRNGELSEQQVRNNSDVNAVRGEANAVAQVGGQQLSAKVYAYGSERGLPGATILYNPYSAQRLDDRTFFVQLAHGAKYGSAVQQKNVLKYHHSYTRYVDPAYQNAAHGLDNRYTQNELYASTATLLQAAPRLSFSASLDGAANVLDANVTDFARPTRYSLWGNAAVRYEHRYVEVMANVLGAAFVEQVQHGARPDNRQSLSPAAALAVKPFGSNRFALRCSYQNTYRMPSFNDLYYAQVGNTALRPEQATQLNAGATFYELREVGYVSLSADVYRGNVRDKIVAMPTRNIFVWSMRNVGRVKISGFDIVARAGYSLAKRYHISLCGSYTFQKSIDKTSADGSTYNHQIPYTPQHSGSATASVETPYASLDYSVVASGGRYALAQNIPQNYVSSYADHNISLRKNFSLYALRCKASAEICNLLNAQYEVVRGFPMPGRAMRLMLQVEI
jgi:outer membrane cobalamin receptor